MQLYNTLVQSRFGPMLINKNDQYIGRSLQYYGEYSWAEVLLLEQLVSPGSVIVEAGSNIGSHTVPLAQRVGAGGKVIAIEPQRLIFQTLSANVAVNSCVNVDAYWAAVGKEKGDISVPELSPYHYTNFGGISIGSSNDTDIKVPLITIDSLELPRCDLIKIDVEGMELPVLQGAKAVLDKYRPALYFEANKKQLPSVLEYVFSQGYQCWWDVPNLFNEDNYFLRKDDIFNVISINVLALPRGANVDIGLQPIESINDWCLDN